MISPWCTTITNLRMQHISTFLFFCQKYELNYIILFRNAMLLKKVEASWWWWLHSHMLLFPYNSFQLALLIFILVGYFRYNKKKYYIFPVESTKKEARFLFLFLWIHCSSSTWRWRSSLSSPSTSACSSCFWLNVTFLFSTTLCVCCATTQTFRILHLLSQSQGKIVWQQSKRRKQCVNQKKEEGKQKKAVAVLWVSISKEMRLVQ